MDTNVFFLYISVLKMHILLCVRGHSAIPVQGRQVTRVLMKFAVGEQDVAIIGKFC